MDTQTKKDMTRLKNLLHEYRTDIITNTYDKQKHTGLLSYYNRDITDIVVLVDQAINLIEGGV